MIQGMTNILIAVAITCICAGLIAGIWLATRAACRKFGLGVRYQVLIPSSVCSIPLLLWVVTSVDRLDPRERTCRDELLKTTPMEGTADLRIEGHYDFWTETISGGGWGAAWASRPYETPKVWLIVQFTRDRRPHKAWIDCVFTKVPGTGEPPQIAFQEVKFDWENVLEPDAKGHLGWVPSQRERVRRTE